MDEFKGKIKTKEDVPIQTFASRAKVKAEIESCTQALRKLSNQINIISNRGNNYFSLKNYKNAEEDCKGVLKVESDMHFF